MANSRLKSNKDAQRAKENYRRKFMFAFIVIQIISIIVSLSINFSLLNTISLLIINILVIFLFYRFFDKVTKNLLSTKQIYNKFSIKGAVGPIILGIPIILYSILSFPKFLAFGLALLFFGIYFIVFQNRMNVVTNRLFELPNAEAKLLFFKRSFFSILAIFSVPILLDFHLMILGISGISYYLIILGYLLSVLSIMVISLYMPVKTNKLP